MHPNIKKIGNKNLHPGIYHQDGAIGRIKNSKVKYGANKIWMFAKFLCPFFKLKGPFFLVSLVFIPAVEQELQLIVAVIQKPEDTHHGQIELLQVTEIGTGMLLDLKNSFICDAERVALQ